MEKYLVIFIIIITLYFIEKYCIQSEVEKFLITKNIIENFISPPDDTFDDTIAFNLLDDIGSDLFKNNNLNIPGNIIINKHKLISDISGLKIRDLSNENFLNLVVKDMDVSGILTVNGPSYFNNALFVNSTDNKQLSITGATISSINSDLLLSASTNTIKLGNTDISGNLSFNNDKKPIISKIISVNNTTPPNINTTVNYEEYSAISFSGYDHSNNQSSFILQFNTIKNTTSKTWEINFTQSPATIFLSSTENRRLKFTFFHRNFVQDCSGNGTNIYTTYCT
jgi:hypothetical protein